MQDEHEMHIRIDAAFFHQQAAHQCHLSAQDKGNRWDHSLLVHLESSLMKKFSFM